MNSKGKQSKGDDRAHTQTMRDIRDEVVSNYPKYAKYASLKPGDFNDEDFKFLRHPSGELLELAESDITLEDAINIVRSGADVYVNPEEYATYIGETPYPSERQYWLTGDSARKLMGARPAVGANVARQNISFYKSENGVLAIHLVGTFDWDDSPR